jgi:hypothetical protein
MRPGDTQNAATPLAAVILNNIILTLPTKKILSDQSSRSADPMYTERRQSLWGETLLNTVPLMRPGDAQNATAPLAAGKYERYKMQVDICETEDDYVDPA